MSARTEHCSEIVILTTTLSLSYALRIGLLVLYRVLYTLYICLRDWRLFAQPFHFIFQCTKPKRSFKAKIKAIFSDIQYEYINYCQTALLQTRNI